MYFVVGFLLGLLAHGAIAPLWITAPGAGKASRLLTIAGWTLLVAGMLLAHSGVVTFWLARTTMFPFRPASMLVTHGPYRFTRNPMYLGLTVGYVGVAVLLNTWWPVILLPLTLALLVKTVIIHEERYLEATFGDEYRAYKNRVRRWL